MLKQGAARRDAGADVVIGVVETHGPTGRPGACFSIWFSEDCNRKGRVTE
jgi:hypothetical protein